MSEINLNAAASGESASPAPAPKKKRKWKLGDRKDGWLLRGLDPMAKVSPFIMKKRSDAQNYFTGELEIDVVEEYIRKKRAEGLQGFGIMHVLIASYLRSVAAMPALNRFVSGHRVYARKDIQVALVIKREMRLDSPDTALKMHFTAHETAEEVYKIINDAIESYRNDPGGDFDSAAGILNAMPRFLLKFAVWVLDCMDYFGWLPKGLTDLSPFHASFFITSMGSLGIPPVYHHIYDFGNVPLFLSFGTKQKRYELNRDGSVREVRYIEYKLVMDERICDGYYFASAAKSWSRMLKHPELLDSPPEVVLEDDRIDKRKKKK